MACAIAEQSSVNGLTFRSLSLYAIIRDWGLDEEFSGAQNKWEGHGESERQEGQRSKGESVCLYTCMLERERECTCMRKGETESADLQNNGVLWSLHAVNPKLSTDLRSTSVPHFFSWDKSLSSVWNGAAKNAISSGATGTTWPNGIQTIPFKFHWFMSPFRKHQFYIILFYTLQHSSTSLFNWVSH